MAQGYRKTSRAIIKDPVTLAIAHLGRFDPKRPGEGQREWDQRVRVMSRRISALQSQANLLGSERAKRDLELIQDASPEQVQAMKTYAAAHRAYDPLAEGFAPVFAYND